jgi:hypothetical protein
MLDELKIDNEELEVLERVTTPTSEALRTSLHIIGQIKPTKNSQNTKTFTENNN